MSLPLTYEESKSSFAHSVTSSLGRLQQAPRLSLIIVSGTLAVRGTSSAEPRRLWDYSYTQDVESTASGTSWRMEEVANAIQQETVEVTRHAVAELRRRSGLTWEQLGRILGVSRRSVHFWASGKPMNAENEAHLFQVLEIVRKADRGTAADTRAALLQPHDGKTSLDLLATESYAEARDLLGRQVTTVRQQLPRTPLSAEARALRKPLSPDELAGALDDPPPLKPTPSRGVQTRRNEHTERE